MLGLRTLSALVMAPPALLATWWGGYAFAALVALAAAIMCWEWDRIVTRRFHWPGQIGALGCLAASLLAVALPVAALVLVLVTAVAAAALAKPDGRQWAGWGVLYAGLPSVALVWLRGDGETGLHTVFWLLLLVWATDIGAYASGRLIGGPLLMPVVSPKKTWAGLIGGVVSAGLVGLAAGLTLSLPHPVLIMIISGALAVVAQAGDLLESWVKRRWGVKDSSNIIPGHGGVLDRVDGLLAAAAAVALASLATGSVVLYWQ
ncbi:MAG: phosphatidate cytidylyltransferase [Rhodospirillaceae bacterium]|nr:phosphatidate cytidylyltransferase [Rhodospirillales bacterium]